MGILGTSSWRDDDSDSVKILRWRDGIISGVRSGSVGVDCVESGERGSLGVNREVDQLCLSQHSGDETSWRTFHPIARRLLYSISVMQSIVGLSILFI